MADVFIRVAGLVYLNEDGSSRIEICAPMKKGRKLHLVDSSSAEHPESISVLNVQKQMLGYIPKSDAEYIRSVISDFSEIEAIFYDSWTISGGEKPFVEIRLRHIKLHRNVIGKFHPFAEDWEKLRDTLGIDYDQKITHFDIERYQMILSGRLEPPVLSHPRKRKPESTFEHDVEVHINPVPDSAHAGCLSAVILCLAFVSTITILIFVL